MKPLQFSSQSPKAGKIIKCLSPQMRKVPLPNKQKQKRNSIQQTQEDSKHNVNGLLIQNKVKFIESRQRINQFQKILTESLQMSSLTSKSMKKSKYILKNGSINSKADLRRSLNDPKNLLNSNRSISNNPKHNQTVETQAKKLQTVASVGSARNEEQTSSYKEGLNKLLQSSVKIQSEPGINFFQQLNKMITSNLQISPSASSQRNLNSSSKQLMSQDLSGNQPQPRQSSKVNHQRIRQTDSLMFGQSQNYSAQSLIQHDIRGSLSYQQNISNYNSIQKEDKQGIQSQLDNLFFKVRDKLKQFEAEKSQWAKQKELMQQKINQLEEELGKQNGQAEGQKNYLDQSFG